jgi:guanylate kinase
LEARLRGRGTESEASIQKRLGNATGEMEKASEVGFFEHNIVNRDVDQTVVEVMRAVGLC